VQLMMEQRGPQQRGFTLVELLVAVVIISVGLLGLAGLQAIGLKNNMSALHRTQASILAMDMIDRMRANRTAALANLYDIGLTGSPSSSNAMAKKDQTAWRDNLSTTLPSGTGAIDCATANPICTITIQWDDSRGAGAAQQFLMSTEL